VLFMRQVPPEDLVSLLGSLGLASPDEVAAVEGRARRLARGLPLFTSVWVDALADAGLLTPFQAVEINAGRGAKLRAGPYALLRKTTSLGYADVYLARQVETGMIRRVAALTPTAEETPDILDRMRQLAAAVRSLASETLAPMEECGGDDGRIWAASDAPYGVSAAEWMIHHGRLPGELVLEIAQHMMPALAVIEQAGFCHGDLRAATLLLEADPREERVGPRLAFPGLRAAVRPREGYTLADLPPEAFDGLAPERVRDGLPPTTSSDVYACGCLWWHLLTGRDPLPGGDGLTKLQATEKGTIRDLRTLAPDAPGALLAAVRECTQVMPEKRPRTMAELAALVGLPPEASRLRREMGRALARMTPRLAPAEPRGAGRRRIVWWFAGVAAAIVVGVVLLVWAVGHGREAASRTAGPGPSKDAQVSISGERPDVPPSVAKSEPHPSGSGAAARSTPPLPDGRGSEESARGSGKAGRGAEETGQRSEKPGGKLSPVADLVLGADGARLEAVEHLSLRPGQRVHGLKGKRVTVSVGRKGLVVDVPGVVFENIDFVWQQAGEHGPGEPTPAILVLEESRMGLSECTFRSTDSVVDAVRWVYPVDSRRAAVALVNGQIDVESCVFRGVTTAIHCRTRGALAIRMSNVLHLGVGALVRLASGPGPDEPVFLALDRTTLRGSGPLAQFDSPESGSAGKIAIESTACVLAPRAGQPLLVFSGTRADDEVLKRVTWTGQGSLVTPGPAIAARPSASGQAESLPEDAIAIEGLVRSEVEFAGPAEGATANSRAIRWLAPLSSDSPPGADVSKLAE
jgi:eukaryotic-like serine/threonine-protein kinase